MMTTELILGVRVETATTLSSAPPGQEDDPRLLGMIHEWYRINNGEWKRFNHKALLLDFGRALNKL